MRIKLDENLPISLAPLLKTLGHDVSTVDDEGLRGKPDFDIWQAAQSEARFLITQDLDFSDLLASLQAHITGFCWFVYILRAEKLSATAS